MRVETTSALTYVEPLAGRTLLTSDRQTEMNPRKANEAWLIDVFIGEL